MGTVDPALAILQGHTPPPGRPAKADSPQRRVARHRNTPTRWALPRVQAGATLLGRFADRWEAVGLDTRAAPIRAAIADAAAVDPGQPTIDPVVLRRTLVEQVADRKLPAAEAAEQLAAVTSDTAAHTRTLARDARHAILGRAVATLYEAGDDLAVELDSVVTAAAEAVSRAVADLDGTATDTDAVRIGGKPMKAWSTITDARRRIDLAWLLAADLRRAGITWTFPGHPPVPPEAWQWRDLAALHRAGPYNRHAHPNLWLAATIAAGAQPGCLTATEVVATHLDVSKAPPLDTEPAR